MNAHPLVGIVMGSDSDLPTMEEAAQVCRRFGVPHEVRVVSAHRTPLEMAEYGRSARARGLRVIVAGAGGAAHLPGMLAAKTVVPGFAPDPCATAEEALEKVDHGRAPAFALVDLDLPGMSGLELLTRLEQLQPETIKILMTAAEGERVDKFRKDHAVFYFRKPLDFPRLLDLLEDAPNRGNHCYC